MTNLPNTMLGCVEHAESAIEKGLFSIRHLLSKYQDFNEEPILYKGITDEEIKEWVSDYEKLIMYVQIILDYLFEAQYLCKRVSEIGDKRNNKGD